MSDNKYTSLLNTENIYHLKSNQEGKEKQKFSHNYVKQINVT